jgi:hypothetical protein
MVTGKGNKRRRRRDEVLAHPAFKVLVVLNIAGAAYAGWLYFNQKDGPPFYQEENQSSPATENTMISTTLGTDSAVSNYHSPANNVEVGRSGQENAPPVKEAQRTGREVSQVNRTKPKSLVVPTAQDEPSKQLGAYTVTKPKVFFHNAPDETTKRKAFINHWNKAVLKPLDDVNGFVYVEYTNHEGQTSRGWMLKKELTPLNR